MKKLIFATIFSVAAFAGFAQDSKPLGFSVGAEVALPMGDFGKSYSLGIGGSAQANYNLDESLALTLNAGYLSYSGKTVSTTVLGQTFSYKAPTMGIIPVLAGIEYKFSENLFASGQLGMSFASKGGGSSFTYAPGIGYKFTPNLSALVKYQGWENASAVGLRVAYHF